MHLFGIVRPWIAYAMIFLCMKTPTWSVMAPVLSLTSKKGGDQPMDVTATSWFHCHTWRSPMLYLLDAPLRKFLHILRPWRSKCPFGMNKQVYIYLFLNSRRWRGRKRERERYIYMIYAYIYMYTYLVFPRANINGRTGCKRTSITGTGCHIVWSHRFFVCTQQEVCLLFRVGMGCLI